MENDYMQQMLDNCAYTFIRLKKGVTFSILEIKDNIGQWSDDVSTAQGWFQRTSTTNNDIITINQQIKLSREQGFCVVVNEFDIDVIDPFINPPNQTHLLPL